MIVVPVSATEVLGEETPIKGDPDSSRSAAEFCERVRAAAAAYAYFCRQAGFSLREESGVAVKRIRSKISHTLVDGAGDLERSTSAANEAFNSYADEVEQIHVSAEQLHNQVTQDLIDLKIQTSTIAAIATTIGTVAPETWRDWPALPMPAPAPTAVPFGTRPEDVGDALNDLELECARPWNLAAGQWNLLRERLLQAAKHWNGLIEERRAAETRLLDALSETRLGGLIRLGVDGGNRAWSIAVGLTGEVRGRTFGGGEVNTTHPLLAGAGFVGGNAAGVWGNPPDAENVSNWWNHLGQLQQEELIDEVPWVIGNLPGVPFADRDRANRAMVETYRVRVHELSNAQLRTLAQVTDILNREARQVSTRGSADPPVQLVALDVTGEVPMVAIGYGDADTSTHTTWEVAGMNSDADDALRSWDEASRNLYREQYAYLGNDERGAVISWLGYDTPGILGVNAPWAARKGADRLVAELNGVSAARRNGGFGLPFTGILAHSYGTTTSAMALADGRLKQPVDSYVMLASAGLYQAVVPTLNSLKVSELEPGQQAIFTTIARNDFLAASGAGISMRGNPNPQANGVLGLEGLSRAYGGALSFSSEGDASQGLLATNGHSAIGGAGDVRDLIGTRSSDDQGYLDARTLSLNTSAQLTTGHISRELKSTLVATKPELPLLGVSPFPISLPIGANQ